MGVRRVLAIGLVLAVAVAVALRLAGGTRPALTADEARAPIDGYPQRIGFERPSPELPDRPGPLAATLYDNDYGNGRPLGVDADGRLWELTRGTNVLSPDGRLLLSAPWESPRDVLVHDLTTGERRDLGVPLALDPALPLHWSGDGRTLVAVFGRGPIRERRTRALDLEDGTMSDPLPGVPVGFADPSEAVTVQGLRSPGAPVVVTTTDLATGRSQRLPLALDRPWPGARGLERMASVSSDGTTLLLVHADGGGSAPDATLRLFSLADGTELASRSVHDLDSCATTWVGDDPVVPTWSRGASAELVTADDSRALVAVHHRLQSRCLQLTRAALAAGPHPAFLGTWDSRWTWYWKPLLPVALLVLVGLVLFVRNVRRNPEDRPRADTPT